MLCFHTLTRYNELHNRELCTHAFRFLLKKNNNSALRMSPASAALKFLCSELEQAL
jgi:hypothetical protein